MATSRRPPWKKSNPKKRRGQTKALSSAQKTAARRRASKAGRRYPNLIDNMAVANAGKRAATSVRKRK